LNDSIRAFYRRIRLRMRLAWLSETTQVYAPYLMVAIVALFVVDWLTDWDSALASAALLLAAYLLALGIGALVLRISSWDASRAAERGLGIRSTLSTALEFDDPENDVHQGIQALARQIAAGADTRRAIPVPVRKDKLRQVAYGTALALVFALLPALGGSTALSGDMATALEAEARELEELAKSIQQADVANSEQISEELLTLAQQLREARTLEEGLAALDSTEKRLTADVDPQFLAQKAAVQGLARDLALRPLVDGAPLGAAEQLEELAERLNELSDPELRSLKDRLADLAAAQASGNPELSSQLASASNALSQGDLTVARQSLNQAARGQQTGVSEARDQQALSETLRALSSVSARLQGEGQGQGDGEGQGQGQGQGDGQGQGQGQNGQAGGGAGGVISGVSPGDGNATGQGGQGTVGSGNPDESGSEAQVTDIYDPVDTGNLSDLLQVTIEGGSADGDIVGRGDAPTERGQSVVPYAQVLPQYLNEAADALQTLRLPPSMRGIVQRYFDQLANEAR
jgi:hypothetical protein